MILKTETTDKGLLVINITLAFQTKTYPIGKEDDVYLTLFGRKKKDIISPYLKRMIMLEKYNNLPSIVNIILKKLLVFKGHNLRKDMIVKFFHKAPYDQLQKNFKKIQKLYK